jgi:hypothetical protein
LKNIISEIESPFEIGESVFDIDIYSTATLTVPHGTKAAYQSTNYWNKFWNIIEASSSAIDSFTPDSSPIREKSYYTLDGQRIKQPRKGINIVKMNDATVKKMIVK